MEKGKFVIIDLRNMDFMKDKDGIINVYDTEEDASLICGIYEFENAWVCELKYNSNIAACCRGISESSHEYKYKN